MFQLIKLIVILDKYHQSKYEMLFLKGDFICHIKSLCSLRLLGKYSLDWWDKSLTFQKVTRAIVLVKFRSMAWIEMAGKTSNVAE